MLPLSCGTSRSASTLRFLAIRYALVTRRELLEIFWLKGTTTSLWCYLKGLCFHVFSYGLTILVVSLRYTCKTCLAPNKRIAANDNTYGGSVLRGFLLPCRRHIHYSVDAVADDGKYKLFSKKKYFSGECRGIHCTYWYWMKPLLIYLKGVYDRSGAHNGLHLSDIYSNLSWQPIIALPSTSTSQ